MLEKLFETKQIVVGLGSVVKLNMNQRHKNCIKRNRHSGVTSVLQKKTHPRVNFDNVTRCKR
jgi:hypothetical protein